jgi:hypothetical protein
MGKMMRRSGAIALVTPRATRKTGPNRLGDPGKIDIRSERTAYQKLTDSQHWPVLDDTSRQMDLPKPGTDNTLRHQLILDRQNPTSSATFSILYADCDLAPENPVVVPETLGLTSDESVTLAAVAVPISALVIYPLYLLLVRLLFGRIAEIGRFQRK